MKVSINKKLIGKPSSQEVSKHHHQFENEDPDLEQFINYITVHGYTFTAHHNGTRKSENFVCSQVLAADIDYGQNFESVANDPWVLKHVSFIYTTANHTEQAHRFRVVLVTQTPITDAATMRYALTGVIDKFAGDATCKDAARIFYGNPNAHTQVIGKVLPDAELEKLIQRGKERLSSHAAREHSRSPGAVRSKVSLPHDTEVFTEVGDLVRVWDLEKGTRVHCPQHVDSRASAFVTRTWNNVPVIYCSTCCSSFYLDGIQPDTGDGWFDYDWNKARTFTVEDHIDNATADPSYVNIEETRGITVFDQRFLPYEESPFSSAKAPSPAPWYFDMPSDIAMNADSDILLIKSPKGSGKTEWLKKYLENLRAADYSVLLISHRRSLIHALCQRLGLASYLSPTGQWQAPTNHFAICLDSLHKLRPIADKYQVVLIDECEQVLTHCLSDTLKEHRRPVLLKLKHYLEAAQRLILLDADLSKLTVNLLDDMLPRKTYRVYLNDWKATDSKIHLFGGSFPHHIVGDMVESLNRGEKLFVCSNSKADIDLLAEQVPLHVKNRDLKLIAITSDNSQEPGSQHFIKNIATEILKYDVVFASPSISTGLDISFPGGGQKIDAVFGIFRPLITTHLDIDQQLMRVRNPKRTCVWVAADEFLFETDPGVIEAEIDASEHEHHVLVSIDAKGRETYLEDALYDRIYSHVTAMQRASKNALRQNFIKYKEAHKCEVVRVEHDKQLASIGAKVLATGRTARELSNQQRVLAASKISRIAYQQLANRRDGAMLKPDETAQMRRWELETFYSEDVSEALLHFDNKGHGRTSVRNMCRLMASDAELVELDSHDDWAFRTDRQQETYRRKLLAELLGAAGLLGQEGQIDPTVKIDTRRLGNFVITLEKNKTALERIFEVAPRADSARKPVMQLQRVLKLTGLKLKKTGRDQSGGEDRAVYEIDPESYQQVMDHATRRLKRLRKSEGE